jgi:hypothetical protein
MCPRAAKAGNNYLLTYDSCGPVHNRFHRGEWITWGSGGGGGPGHPGPLNDIERSECHLGPERFNPRDDCRIVFMEIYGKL